MIDALRRNYEVCREQWALYQQEVRVVILPGIRNAPVLRKPHKAFAFVEEFYDKCPRIAAYLDWLRVPLELVGIAGLLAFVL